MKRCHYSVFGESTEAQEAHQSDQGDPPTVLTLWAVPCQTLTPNPQKSSFRSANAHDDKKANTHRSEFAIIMF